MQKAEKPGVLREHVPFCLSSGIHKLSVFLNCCLSDLTLYGQSITVLTIISMLPCSATASERTVFYLRCIRDVRRLSKGAYTTVLYMLRGHLMKSMC